MFDFLKKKEKAEKTIMLSIDGMHCPSCSMNIDGALEELDGVYEAKTQYANAKTTVSYDGKLSTQKNISSCIKNLGYTVDTNA